MKASNSYGNLLEEIFQNSTSRNKCSDFGFNLLTTLADYYLLNIQIKKKIYNYLNDINLTKQINAYYTKVQRHIATMEITVYYNR